MRKIFFIPLLCSSLLIGCTMQQPVPRAASFDLTLKEQERLEKKALAEDGVAAYQLYLFHLIVKQDLIKAKYWYAQAYQQKYSGCKRSPDEEFPESLIRQYEKANRTP